MASSLDSSSSNLVGVSGMVCNECGGSCEFTHVNENYIAHGKCRNCYSGYSKHQLSVLNDFDNLRSNHTDEQFRLLLRKGVYPYEYVSSWDKFKETKLPPKEAFHSKLNMSDISVQDYKHAQKVWKSFGLKNLGEYHDLYLKTDVMPLTKLNPSHFYASTG